jgi:glycosyltransferase involved in cell wall biosynthesis
MESAVTAVTRILYVVNNIEFFRSHRWPLAEGARAAGFDVHVATPNGENDAAMRAAGFQHHPFHLARGGQNPLRDGRSLTELVALYRHVRPALVHHVTIKPVVYGGLAARIARVPAVVQAVSGLGYVFMAKGTRARLRRTAVIALYKQAFAHPNLRAIFQNRDDERELCALRIVRPEQAVHIAGSGVDLSAFSVGAPPDKAPALVVLPARTLWDKGVGEFVQAARILRDRARGGSPPARFALVGGPDPHNPTAVDPQTLDTWAREGVVEVWGHRTDMPRVLAQAAIVCLPSYREGMPKTLLEACAASRPIVTTDVPGCREAVRNGENGFVVPPRDPNRLADALGTLLDDPDLRQRMGAAGRARAEREFDVRAVVSRTLALYRELMRGL